MLTDFGVWPVEDRIFFFVALAGSLGFLVWLVLQFVGGFSPDVDAGGVDLEGGSSSDIGFTLLSFQGITAFLTMFGLVGLAVLREAGQGVGIATGAGAAAGLAMNWVLARLFRVFRTLQSSGNREPQAALGAVGEVYLRIRPGESGQVQVHVQGRLQVLSAISEGTETLETGTRVRVHRVDGPTLVVEPA